MLLQLDYYYRFTKNVIGLDEFGFSAKKTDLLNYFGFEEEKLVNKIKEMLGDKYE